ncbi:MAG: amino acid permease [Chloracidobacterium sp.]|nr:amino acid permease [Chloracidobacterium sp.]MCC6826422.1 amino acid permease [Acidobacteriota bacterium]MCO5334621.1 amino acid permease [Pyrinomonadaceae bacterium]
MSTELGKPQQLVRALGLVAAVSIIIGNVIGTGVFLKARVMTCNVGAPAWVLLAWIAAGLLSLAGALTYAELTAMKPEAGGEYVFLRDAYGRASSFLFGWMQMFIAKPGSQAAAGMAFAIGLNDFLDKKLEETLLTFSIGGIPFEITTLTLVAIMVILIFTTLNCASVSLSGQIATALTGVKIGLILFVSIGAFVWATGDFSHFSLLSQNGACEGVADGVRFGSASYSFVGGFGAAMIGALWGYDGWNNLTFVAGEVKDPNRNIPLAIIGSTILIIILYVIANISYYYVLDPTAVASVSKSSAVAKVVVAEFFGGNVQAFATGLAVAIFTTGLMLSSLGTLHTSILSGARVPYAMAQDGLMFHVLGKLSITGVPVKALLLQMVWAMMLAVSGSFDTLTDYVIFGSWIFYALVTSSVFVFRRKYPELERPYKAWGYPVVPAIFLVVAGWLLYITFSNDLVMIKTALAAEPGIVGLMKGVMKTSSFAGTFLILLGLPVYYFISGKNGRPEKADNEG